MSMVYVMWEASVLVGQLCAVQEGNALGWIIKEAAINFGQGKKFLSSWKRPDNS
jgi:hypothetical protein